MEEGAPEEDTGGAGSGGGSEEVEGAGRESLAASDLEDVAGAVGSEEEEEEEEAGTEEAVRVELEGDCDGGGAAEDEAVSASEGNTEEVEATEDEGPGGGLEGAVWFWLLVFLEYVWTGLTLGVTSSGRGSREAEVGGARLEG